MSDTPPPAADPGDGQHEATTDTRSPDRPGSAAPRRRLPFGPFGMLLTTAVALVAAIAAGAVVQGLVDDDDGGAVPIQEALDGSATAPLVLDGSARAEVGSPAPDVLLEYLDGGSEQLAEVAGRGTPVVLNFWASTCVPCLKEMPAFEEVHGRYSDDEVRFIGIDVADTEQAGRDMVEKTGVTYPNARDPRAEIFAAYGGIALPRTVLIGGDGTVLATHSGELTAQELTDLLAEHDLVPV